MSDWRKVEHNGARSIRHGSILTSAVWRHSDLSMFSHQQLPTRGVLAHRTGLVRTECILLREGALRTPSDLRMSMFFVSGVAPPAWVFSGRK